MQKLDMALFEKSVILNLDLDKAFFSERNIFK